MSEEKVYYNSFEEFHQRIGRRAASGPGPELAKAVRVGLRELTKEQLEQTEMMRTARASLIRLAAACDIMNCTLDELVAMQPFNKFEEYHGPEGRW